MPCFAIVLIGILAIIAKTIPMDLGPAANPADTHFLPRPGMVLPAGVSVAQVSQWPLVADRRHLLPALLALIFAAAPFLDRRLERSPWRRPIFSGRIPSLPDCLHVSWCSQLSGRSSRSGSGGADAQAGRGYEDLHAKPFVPEAAAGSVSAALVSADPKVLKGQALFQASSCNSCHGDGGVGTAAAGPLTGVGQKYTDAQLIALLRSPNSKMTDGGMTAVDLKQDDLEALVAYLRQLH